MQPKKDKSLEKKLDKLCGESAELVARYLSDEKIKVLSVAPLLGEAILRNNRGLSISELFT